MCAGLDISLAKTVLMADQTRTPSNAHGGLACRSRDLPDDPGGKRVCGRRARWYQRCTRLSHHRLRVALDPRGWSSPQRGCQAGVGALVDGAQLAMQAPVYRPW
jgi:hypothetical protein